MSQKGLFQNGVNTFSKMVYHFWQKSQSFVYFVPYYFLSNFTSLWSKYLPLMYGETLDFQCQHQSWQHKMHDQKINFWSKFAINILSCYRCKRWHWKFEVSTHYLIRIWTTCWWNLNQIVWPKMYKILIFWQKIEFLKPFIL